MLRSIKAGDVAQGVTQMVSSLQGGSCHDRCGIADCFDHPRYLMVEADQKCTPCGICEAVCISGKIRLAGKQPVWQRAVLCYMCFADVNHCPTQSVQIRSIWAMKSRSTENGRYGHLFANAGQIAVQKARQENRGIQNPPDK